MKLNYWIWEIADWLKGESVDTIDIVTIAFNNVNLIDYQVKLLKKNIKDAFLFTVFDNSNNEKSSILIKQFCDKHGVPYLKLNNINDSRITPSQSHALALNCVIQNFIRYRTSKYFVLLDHDIFPIKKYSFIQRLNNQAFYWVKVLKQKFGYKYYYMWPWFCIFNKDKFNFNLMDFSPNFLWDTGVMNYSLYRKYDIWKYEFSTRETLPIIKNPSNYYEDQDWKYELIDWSWIHFINAGEWVKTHNYKKKMYLLYKLLDKNLL